MNDLFSTNAKHKNSNHADCSDCAWVLVYADGTDQR